METISIITLESYHVQKFKGQTKKSGGVRLLNHKQAYKPSFLTSGTYYSKKIALFQIALSQDFKAVVDMPSLAH